MVEDIRTQWFRFFRQTSVLTIRKFSRRSFLSRKCRFPSSPCVTRTWTYKYRFAVRRNNEREWTRETGFAGEAGGREKYVESRSCTYPPTRNTRHILSKLGEDVLSRRTRVARAFTSLQTNSDERQTRLAWTVPFYLFLSESYIWHISYDRPNV